ncbi:MAG: RagB/SusD family nutrient uptake outer membrane protein [Sphingobacterium sp.]|jgi:hypothetical protein|nr:RagB/SusD family nutrient uptake outer membrane protein [Sphingobacterium sp.]
MKQILFILLASSFLLYQSCGKSFLEIDPVGTLTGEKLFSDPEGYESSLAGTYSLFAKYHLGSYGLYSELRSDNVLIEENLAGGILNEYNYTSEANNSIGMVGGLWQSIYETLNNANNIIEAKDNLLRNFPEKSDLINRTYGEALIIRAICHFDLSNLYSQHYTYTADGSHLGIPTLLKTPFPGTEISRPSIKETYQQIIADLTQAKSLLSTVSLRAKIYGSSDVAQALLSRIYLYMEDWDAVIAQAHPLVVSNKYPLTSGAGYLKMFIDPSQRRNYSSIPDEVIWQVNLVNNSQSYLTYLFSDPANYNIYPTKEFVGLFGSGDFRSSQFQPSGRKPGYHFNAKYALPSGTLEGDRTINFKMFRSAELYLNLAEAYYHKQEYAQAVAQLQIVRGRAYNINPTKVQISYTQPIELLAQIKLERRKEFAFENQRIFDIMRYKEDLNRTECNSTACRVTYPNDKFILPIPQLETDANPAMQPNPGYN